MMYDLCRAAVRAGYIYPFSPLSTQTDEDTSSALSFHAVSFGVQARAGSLRRMVQIAMEIHDAAPRDPLAPPGNPCSYSEALDTVRHVESLGEYLCSQRRQIQLANTFLAIADSLHNPRATLKRRI